MTIGYTLQITEWGGHEDKLSLGIPNDADEDGRTYNPMLKVKTDEVDGHDIYDKTECCRDLGSAIWEGIVQLGVKGTYPNHELWLYMDSRKGPHAYKITMCPFCGEDMELECDRVIIREPTWERKWRRTGSKTLEEKKP